jgi:hypothetical protein
MQNDVFDVTLFEQFDSPSEISVMRRVLLRRDVRGGDIRPVKCLELFGFNQGRSRCARAVPVAQMQVGFFEAFSQVAHHPCQEP